METVEQVVNYLCCNSMPLSGYSTISATDNNCSPIPIYDQNAVVGYSMHYTWWPQYWSTVDKHAVAFRVVKRLMEKKLVKLDSIDKFITVVDEIVAVM